MSAMRNDEVHDPKPRSNQTRIPGLGMKGELITQEAQAWIDGNPHAYEYMVEQAKRLHRKGYVSANYLVNMVRNELHVKVKNGYAPALARIIEKQHPELEGAFRMHRSETDGWL